MARQHRSCGGLRQRKVGYLRAQHGKSSPTQKFSILVSNRRRTIVAMLHNFARACRREQRWQRQQLHRQQLVFHNPGRWCARGLVAA